MAKKPNETPAAVPLFPKAVVSFSSPPPILLFFFSGQSTSLVVNRCWEYLGRAYPASSWERVHPGNKGSRQATWGAERRPLTAGPISTLFGRRLPKGERPHGPVEYRRLYCATLRWLYRTLPCTCAIVREVIIFLSSWSDPRPLPEHIKFPEKTVHGNLVIKSWSAFYRNWTPECGAWVSPARCLSFRRHSLIYSPFPLAS